MQLLTNEEAREKQRDELIENTATNQEKEELLAQFKLEREEASKKIKQASEIHEKQIKKYIHLKESLQYTVSGMLLN